MTVEPPTRPPAVPRRRAPSVVIVHTGDGRGKSTAAFGTALRALARGWRVAVVQFVKSGRWRAGEALVLPRLGVEWHTLGAGFTWEAPTEASVAAARQAWSVAQGLLRDGRSELVILDEVTYPINYGWLELDEVLRAIRGRAPHTNVILTGRDAPPALVELADTVTEMRKVKHAMDAGSAARRGIEY